MLRGKELWSQVREEFQDKPIKLSSYSSCALRLDIKHFLFTFARYKFAAKMFENRKDLTALELGCNDGLGTIIFEQMCRCRKVIGVDFDAESIEWAKQNLSSEITTFIEDDFLGKEYASSGVDVVVSLDVIEHIETDHEMEFLDTVYNNLNCNGIAILGTPNVQMHQYTSERNKKAHINNYSQKRFYELLNKKFHNVFIFGMNDEVLHTGFYPMASYIMAICSGKK